MLTIDTTIEIAAPPDLVWKKLAKLDDVQHWLGRVKTARFATGQTEGVGAQRICEVDGVGTLKETITNWNDGKTLTYAVEGMPRVVKHAQNTWQVEEITPERTRVSATVEIQTRYGGAGALFARHMMKPQLGAFLNEALREFRDYVEGHQDRSAPSVRPVQAQVP